MNGPESTAAVEDGTIVFTSDGLVKDISAAKKAVAQLLYSLKICRTLRVND